jgi:hypothetical protein
VEPFQGHNAKHVFVVFDEGSSIDQKFSDAADAEATRLLEIGNPLVAMGPFYNHSRSTEYNHIHISCLDHPNIKLGREVIPGGPRPEWVEGRKKAWNYPKGPLWLGRVAGEFPEEAEDTLFPLSIIRQSFELYRRVRELVAKPDATKALGLDVARAGGDRTVGYNTDWVLYQDPEQGERNIHRSAKILDLPFTDHFKTRMKVMELNQRENWEKVNVDAGGEGSGLADELPQAGVRGVQRVLFGSSPGDQDYFDCRAEMFWQLSIAMKAGNYAIEPDDELEEELSVIGAMRSLKEKMVNSTKRAVFWLPPKEEMKEKLGRSPDKADALALANYKFTKATGFLDFYQGKQRAMQEQASQPKPQPDNGGVQPHHLLPRIGIGKKD